MEGEILLPVPSFLRGEEVKFLYFFFMDGKPNSSVTETEKPTHGYLYLFPTL